MTYMERHKAEHWKEDEKKDRRGAVIGTLTWVVVILLIMAGIIAASFMDTYTDEVLKFFVVWALVMLLDWCLMHMVGADRWKED